MPSTNYTKRKESKYMDEDYKNKSTGSIYTVSIIITIIIIIKMIMINDIN